MYLTLSVLALVMVSNSVMAASFDCSKASTSTEKMICSNESLSSLDEEMDANYARIFPQGGRFDLGCDVLGVKPEQRHWIMNVRNKCKTVECLIDAYRQRNAELKEIGADLEKRFADTVVVSHTYVHPHTLLEDDKTGPAIRRIVGKHFSLLDANLSGPSEGLVVEKNGGKSGNACLPHACTVGEAMIHIASNGRIYIAILDRDKLMYFSDDPAQKTKMYPSVAVYACDRAGSAKIMYMSK